MIKKELRKGRRLNWSRKSQTCTENCALRIKFCAKWAQFIENTIKLILRWGLNFCPIRVKIESQNNAEKIFN